MENVNDNKEIFVAENQIPSGMPEQGSVNQDQEVKDFVAYETYQRTLAEAKSAKATKNELMKQNEELLAQLQRIEEEKLKKDGEYKKIAELREQEARKEKERADALEKDIMDTWKFQAFFNELGGTIDSKFLSHVPLSEIAIDPETRAIDEASVKEVVSNFRKEYYRIIDEKDKPSGLPSSAAKPVKPKGINEMDATERKAFMNESLKAWITR